MLRKSFNEKWEVSGGSSVLSDLLGPQEQKKLVDLPYDAMVHEHRSQDSKKSNHAGFFPGGAYTYVKNFSVPEEYKSKTVIFEFEGVYANAKVLINGEYAGKQPYGYTNFYIRADRFLKYGEENEIKVLAKTPLEPDTRWYCGGGIYRNVKMMVGGLFHIVTDGVLIATPDIEKDFAVVEIATTVTCEEAGRKDGMLVSEIKNSDGVIVASEKTRVTIVNGEEITLRQRVYVESPTLWSMDTPYLYTCESRLYDGETLSDEDVNIFGIRKLQLDNKYGLRINGEVVKLRGGCIHHDNGVIGACTFERAEERRVELLKAAGYNAIRSAHNPMSKEMLDACDRVGMLVMDETFDTWHLNKTDYDYSLYFEEWWERDTEAMVKKDFNHPCVILYSIGNEIPETGLKNNCGTGRKMAEKIRSMDETRYVLNSINGMLAIMPELKKMMAGQGDDAGGDINAMMSNIGEFMSRIMTSDFVTHDTEETFSQVDVAGYNYMASRYEADKDRFPNRIMVGSETFPPDLQANWALVKSIPQVIGDFSWTSWDYIGEAGVGKFDYTMNEAYGLYGPYPWYIAYCGDIDITGHRRPLSYWREIVWGLRKEPYIAVQKVNRYGQKFLSTTWTGGTDTLSSWTWPGYEGKPAVVEVYSGAEEVELLINGKSLGKAKVGADNGFKAVFETVYSPGELTAVAYEDGQKTGRNTIKTAGPEVELCAQSDKAELQRNCGDLAYIAISLRDKVGVLNTATDRKVKIAIEGAGRIQGYGSADPQSLENFFDEERTTFEGKALAVICPGSEAGDIRVTFSAEGLDDATVEIKVK